MSKTRELLRRINSIKKTKKITQAMKVVSASKFSKYSEKLKNLDYFKLKNEDLASILEYNMTSLFEEEGKKSILKNALIVLISSDKGLCGSFNSKLFQTFDKFYLEKQSIFSKIDVLPIGKKALEYTKKQEYSIKSNFASFLKKFEYHDIKEISDYIISCKNHNIYSEFYIISNTLDRKNNKVKISNLFEINKKNQFDKQRDSLSFIFEPSNFEILETYKIRMLHLKIYYYIISSLTAEYSSRMIAMTKATDNADSMLQDLNFLYNSTRQSNITKELIEIVSGAEALKK